MKARELVCFIFNDCVLHVSIFIRALFLIDNITKAQICVCSIEIDAEDFLFGGGGWNQYLDL